MPSAAARRQDPAGKSGVGNMVASLIDEGSGDLDSKTFHERLDRRAIELELLLDAGLFPRLAAHAEGQQGRGLRPAASGADLAAFRRRPTSNGFARRSISGLRRDTTNPTSLASRKFLEVAFGDHPYGRQANGTLDSVPKIDVADMKDYVAPRDRQGYAADRRGRRRRCRYARQAAGQDLRRIAGQGQSDAGRRCRRPPSRRSAPSSRSTCRKPW